MKCVIRFRDGKVYLMAEIGLTDEPKIRYLFWLTKLDEGTAKNVYGIVDGDEASPHPHGNGYYNLLGHKSPSGAYLTIQLVHGGETKAEHISEVSVSCPKVRRGTETRWNGIHGRWEKNLKREGWVPA